MFCTFTKHSQNYSAITVSAVLANKTKNKIVSLSKLINEKIYQKLIINSSDFFQKNSINGIRCS